MPLSSFTTSYRSPTLRQPKLPVAGPTPVTKPTIPGQPDSLESLVQAPAIKPTTSFQTPATGSTAPSIVAKTAPQTGSSFTPPSSVPIVGKAAPQTGVSFTPAASPSIIAPTMPKPEVGPTPPAPGQIINTDPKSQVSSQQAEAAKQIGQGAAGQAAPATNVADLNALVEGTLSDTLKGKNPAMELANRTAMTGMAAQEKNAMAQAARRASAIGAVPGSPEYERIMQDARDGVVSAGSALLSDVAGQGLAAQERAIANAGNFALGQQNYGLNALRRDDQVGQFGKTLGENQRQFDVNNSNTLADMAEGKRQFDVNAGQNQQQISNQASQFQDTLAQRKSEFGTTSGQNQQQIDAGTRQQQIQNLEAIVNNPLSSVAEVQAAKAKLRDINQLGAGADAADPSAAQQDLETIKQGLRVRYPGMSETEIDTMARQRFGQADDAYWESLGIASKIDKPADGSGGGDTSGFYGGFKQPFTKEGDFSIDDSGEAIGRGFENLGEGNVLTGSGQVLGGVLSVPGNVISDVNKVAGDASDVIEEGMEEVGDFTGRQLKKLKFW